MVNKKTKKTIRLPNYVVPISYNLTIHPDLESSSFQGSEIIKIKIERQTNKIILHSKDIDIKTAIISSKQKVVSSKGKKQKQFATKIFYDNENETVTLFFKNKVQGNCQLHLTFLGIINDGLRGFYKSKYILDNQEKCLVTTQFEATDARRAFPCFDEPAHKAIFNVSLVVCDNQTAISNTLPTKIKEYSAGYKIISFSPTPKMSTYLLAFIIGEFEYVEGYANKTTLVRVYTTPGKKHQAKFALDVAIKTLEFYNQYFDIPYPLPTLDMIAIPDFESAAMENWGAITYRESMLLVDEEHTALENKQWVAIVIAHEIAHQWFGNLVTMHWWTDLWLNEGFATYIEYLAVDHMFPHWKIWNQFLISDHNFALTLDGLKNSHPVEIVVHHPNEIGEIFDRISYSKGASIIRMLAEYLGENKFKEGLRHYLKKHSYQNTETQNLWEALEKVSGKPIKKMMNSWTKQTGYPLLSITSSENKDVISQERFFSSRVSRKENTIKNLWYIPIDVNNKKIFLDKKSNNIKEKIIGKINNGESSFIRVKYDKDNLDLIKQEIIEGQFSVIDRLGIIRDLFALAEGGYIKTSIVLDFSLFYKNESEYIIWKEIASGINRINNLISKENFQDKYQKYVRSLFSPLAQKMGFETQENEKHSDIFLRNLAISMASAYEDKKVIRQTKKIFDNKIVKPIKADIKRVIYNSIAKNGKEKEWKIFESLYKKEEMHEEKERLAIALTNFKDEKLLLKTLHFALSSHVRQQNAPTIINMVWQNNYGKELSWNFIKNNWPELLKRYGAGGFSIGRLLAPLSTHIKKRDAIYARKFFSKNQAPGAENTLKQAYEKIESNAVWIKDDKKDIQNWLNKNF